MSVDVTRNGDLLRNAVKGAIAGAAGVWPMDRVGWWTVSISGVYLGMEQSFPLGDLFDKQLQLRMGQANVRRWVDDIMPLLSDDDPLGSQDFATHLMPLGHAPKGYAIFQNKEDNAFKVVLQP